MKYCLSFSCLVLLLFVTGGATAQQVYMNEIYTRGVTEAPDWIELYNTATVAVDVSGYRIYDSGGLAGTKPKKQLPAGTVIPANGFYVVVTDGPNPEDFGLSSGGEAVWLEDASGAVIDTVAFPALETTQSFGRYPNGGAPKILTLITRGTSNVPVLMNEIYSRGVTADPDWIEFYNTATVDIDISGYRIYDSGGLAGTKPKKQLPAGTIVPANGFYVVVTDGANPEDFGLSSGGEAVWLEDTTGTVIDTVAFTAMETTQSFSRIPDAGVWGLVNTITRGATNGTGTAVEEQPLVATDFRLEQNYPNPFNPSTTIAFVLDRSGEVRLRVYDLLGREVGVLINGYRDAGRHAIVFDARNLASGTYFLRLESSGREMTRPMMLIK